jgi:hypothetical protein
VAELRAPRVRHLEVGLVDRRGREHVAAVGRRLVDEVELQRAIGQLAVAVAEELVDRAGPDEVVVVDGVLDVLV